MSIFVILLNQNGNKAFEKANKEHLIIFTPFDRYGGLIGLLHFA